MKRRRLWLWILLSLLVVGMLAGAWIARTESGLRFAIARVQAALPGLHIGRSSGLIGDRVRLDDLSYRSANVEVAIAQADLQFEFSALMFGGIDLDTLHLRDVRIRLLPPAAQTSQDKTPEISLPKVRVRELRVAGLRIERPEGETLEWSSIRAAVSLSRQTIAVDELNLVHARFIVDGSTRVVLDDPWLLRASTLSLRSTPNAPRPFAARLLRAAGGASPFELDTRLPLKAHLQIRPGRDFQYSDIRLSLPSQAATVLGLPADLPIAAELALSRKAGRIGVAGTASAGSYRVRIPGASMQLLDVALQIDALPLDLVGRGLVNVSGVLPYGNAAPLQLSARTSALRWEIPGQPDIHLSGEVQLSGRYDDLVVQPELRLEQEGLPPGMLSGRATLAASAIRFDALRLQLPRGAVSVDGALARDAAAQGDLRLALDAFDPSLFFAAWPGALSGTAAWHGAWTEAGADGVLRVERITGQLRGQAVDLQGQVLLEHSAPRAATAQVGFGSAHAQVDGDLAGPEPLRIAVDIPDLGVLDSAAAGKLQLTAARTTRWRIDATGSALRWQDMRLGSMGIEGEIGSGWDEPVDLSATLSALGAGGVLIDKAHLTLAGTRGEHAVEARLDNAQASLAVAANGSWSASQWSGVIERFDIGFAADRQLRLEQPVNALYSAATIDIEQACWSGDAQSRLCLRVRQHEGAGEAAVDIGALPLSWLSAWQDDAPVSIADAVLKGRASAQWQAQRLLGASLDLTSDSGRVLVPDRADLLLGYRDLQVTGTFADDHGKASMRAQLLPEGHVEAQFDLGRDSNDALAYDGTVSLLVRQLDVIEAFTTEVANPTGMINGQFRVQQDEAGFRAGGSLALSDFGAEVPSLGLKLSKGSVALAGVPDGYVLRGAIQSGEGILSLDGRWSRDAGKGLSLHISGENVTISNTPQLNLHATPDLELKRDKDGWNLTGTVDIPRARIRADQLGGGTTRSGDVVVVDDIEDVRPAERWRARVQVHMGDDVQLTGFGFDGKLQGQLVVLQRLGRSATATGQLDVLGNYSAYGQKLTIERGGLFYAGSPLDEPSLRVRAERKIGDRTAGIEITGTARRPISRVYAQPSASESEALALLVTGRPLNELRGGELNRVSGAALALGTIGGDMLAKNLGLDELGVSSNSGVQGEAFTIGKYLSPRLFIGYGIGLLTRGEVFTVRYKINQRVDVEANIGERQRAALNYRIER